MGRIAFKKSMWSIKGTLCAVLAIYCVSASPLVELKLEQHLESGSGNETIGITSPLLSCQVGDKSWGGAWE